MRAPMNDTRRRAVCGNRVSLDQPSAAHGWMAVHIGGCGLAGARPRGSARTQALRALADGVTPCPVCTPDRGLPLCRTAGRHRLVGNGGNRPGYRLASGHDGRMRFASGSSVTRRSHGLWRQVLSALTGADVSDAQRVEFLALGAA